MMQKKRIAAIDVLRGLSLIGMMLVNLTPDEALAFPALVHTEWFGITLADVFFPCFLFLSGVSAAINAERKIFGEHWLRSALKRGVLLILIGIVYYHLTYFWALIFNPGYGVREFLSDLTHYFRPFGVLQRIGFAYFFGILICHFAKTEKKSLISAFIILFVTTAGFFFYSFKEPFSEIDNISIFVDQMLQGSNHNHMQKIFDPEGLYSNITAIASMIFGIVAGMELKAENHSRLVRLGCALSLFGWFTSAFVIVSKPLWTAPYVLILSGIFMIILSATDGFMKSHAKAEKWLKLPITLGAHSMFTYLVSGNIEAILNSVKVGDGNLYHFIWKNTVYFESSTGLSCLLCSLVPIALVCVIVCVCVTLLKKKNKAAVKTGN